MPQRLGDHISPSAKAYLDGYHVDVVNAVRDAVEAHSVVVVGMAHNPHVYGVRKALKKAGVPFHYMGYGSYFSQWRPRLAIKLWSGWPTFPQVFVNGQLLGGEKRTRAALEDGQFQAYLNSP